MLFLFSITWGAVSGWWVPACLALGLLYAWVLYRQPVIINKKFRYWLFTIRSVVVCFIALLLVSPLIKTVSYTQQKPLVLVLQDNSQSVKMFRHARNPNWDSFVDGLASLKANLGNQYDVQEFHFGADISPGLSKTFNSTQTDISKALQQLNNRFVNQNIGALVLATDGLYNQGADPQYEAKNIKTNIYTIVLGDTTPKRDLLIGNVNYNKTAFLGNDFEIEVLTQAYQSKGETMHLTVTEDGRQVSFQNVEVNSNTFQKTVTLKLNADKKGLRKFNIGIAPVKNEISTQNNTETIYVEVLDGKQKILLLYDGPHPDIGVVRQAIESNKNYEIKTSPMADLTAIKPADYSLIILYQLTGDSNGVLQTVLKSKTPVWYMLGAQTNLTVFNSGQKLMRINPGRQDMQEVFAQPVASFNAFTLSDSARKKIAAFPPLLAPYASYSTTGNTILKQRIGNVETAYPLLTFGDDAGRRTAIFTGEGLWRWQLAEYQTYGNHHAIEELLGQGVQYLTANANRQRYIVYPAKNVFDEGENVIINAELYNDALELINTPDVKIDLKSDQGKSYSFLFARNAQSYQLNAGTLPAGGYSYTATATSVGKPLTAHGQLTVKLLNLEARQSVANYQLLNAIAQQSGGQMLPPAQINCLASLIRKNENIKTIVYQNKRYSDIIDVKWFFAAILLLLSTEWVIRKREGEI